MGKKVFIAALIVIGILFAVFVAVGTREQHGDASAEPSGALGSLMKRAKGQSDVPLSDLSADCLKSGGVLIVQFPCALRVSAGGEGLRTVRLTAIQGTVEVSAPLPDRGGGSTDNNISKRLSAGDEKKDNVNVAVGKNGAVISLICSGCQLRIGA